MAAPWLKKIDITPTWVSVMPVLFALMENGTELGRKSAREELMRLATALDAYNKIGKESNLEVPKIRKAAAEPSNGHAHRDQRGLPTPKGQVR